MFWVTESWVCNIQIDGANQLGTVERGFLKVEKAGVNVTAVRSRVRFGWMHVVKNALSKDWMLKMRELPWFLWWMNFWACLNACYSFICGKTLTCSYVFYFRYRNYWIECYENLIYSFLYCFFTVFLNFQLEPTDQTNAANVVSSNNANNNCDMAPDEV